MLCHILNLIVQDGLKEIDAAVEKIRDSDKYLRGSQVGKKEFVECVIQLSLDNQRV